MGSIKRVRDSKKNVTKMIVLTSLIFLLGNVLNPVIYFCVFVFNVKLENTLLAISLISNTLLFGSYGVDIFIYYSFNNKYRSVFKELIVKRLFKKQRMTNETILI